jgi:integrase
MPRQEQKGFTVAALCDHFLNHKRDLMDSGELSPRTHRDYKDVTDLLVAHFGKDRLVTDLRQEDFATLRVKLARRWGPVRLGNIVQRVRTIFKYAFDAEHIDKPVRFGPGFKRPSKKTLRIERAKDGPKLFTREEILRLLDCAPVQMRAMILLGINCGYGNADVARLPLSALDLDRGIADYAREKTGAPRRCILWPETVQAVHAALVQRLEPDDAEHAGLVFITAQRGTWYKDTPDSPVAKVFSRLMKQEKIAASRKGLGFYTLRHTYRTVADETKDQPACNLVMGHEAADMSTQYRERISDERLKAISDHVRAWLFAPAKKGGDGDQVGEQEPATVEELQEDDQGDDNAPALLAFPTARIA